LRLLDPSLNPLFQITSIDCPFTPFGTSVFYPSSQTTCKFKISPANDQYLTRVPETLLIASTAGTDCGSLFLPAIDITLTNLELYDQNTLKLHLRNYMGG